ncbi:Competence-damage protein cinA [Roseomonas mucosa]|uniref:CinA family protein n=1 Tax=Roseomonas mucosa TaxID=207340 RepID=UPI00220FCE52|nr:CinA family protein [Roseomonas mucosa]QDJ08390.1 Competence-damage protein cinA [Roseomonas mucosa]
MEDLLPRAMLLGELLKRRAETVAVAESSAGGLVSAALLAIPGASAYFMGGAVVYTRRARSTLLAITEKEMAGLRPATEPYAMLLASSVQKRFATHWGIAETGAAGPGGNRYGDPAGHACIAVAGPMALTRRLETGSQDRPANMRTFAAALLDLLIETMESGAGTAPQP